MSAEHHDFPAASCERDTDLAADLVGLTPGKESQVLIRLVTTRMLASHAAIPDTSADQRTSLASDGGHHE
jgi:hypothetical protein